MSAPSTIAAQGVELGINDLQAFATQWHCERAEGAQP
jgi:hypothetical protein